MPGRRDAAPIDTSLCRRCQTVTPVITVRTEPLCSACFCRYVSTKAVKRMESFRVRHADPGAEKTLLLPLSFGAGSTALLLILSERLKAQVGKTGRTGFRLRVLHVDDGSRNGGDDGGCGASMGRVKERFPEHEYHVTLLSDFLSSGEIKSLFTHGGDDELDSTSPATTDVASVLTTLKSPTARADALQILRRRHIVQYAKDHDCDSILWGDSTTRLAERTLAETAKGRGFALPWLISDGESPQGITFHYPMRELLSKEILAFTSMVEPPLTALVVDAETKVAVSTRNTSIDDLMRQYFEGVEREYPSIVANVVRTTGKLEAARWEEVAERCELCEVPLGEGRAPERSRVCWGCVRTLPAAVESA